MLINVGDPGQWTYLRNLGTRTLLVVIIHNAIYPNLALKKMKVKQV
jgi:hypothetical protein